MHWYRAILGAVVALAVGCSSESTGPSTTQDPSAGGGGSPDHGSTSASSARALSAQSAQVQAAKRWADTLAVKPANAKNPEGFWSDWVKPEPRNLQENPLVWCPPIVNGTSGLFVDGFPRLFDVQLPENTSGPVALLFLWHGWMQWPPTFHDTIVYDVPSGNWVPFDPNAFPMPLVIVTPWDYKFFPPFGLDWDITNGAFDFQFFDGMTICLSSQFQVDNSRIYTFGFSAGAVFADLLASKYPTTIAGTIAESGMWFNDKPEQADVYFDFMLPWRWPALNPADRGNVLLTHGGPKDFATVISLESANKKAIPFLRTNARTVTECTHTFGHTLDPDLTQTMLYDWMWDHQLGGAPLTGLPVAFPTPAKPVGVTQCLFHSSP